MKKLTPDQEKRLKLMAKMLAIHGYRNSPIEDIHAGRWPKNKNGKYASSDEVIVTTKDNGTIIPWSECSKINDSEMKEMNKQICNQIYTMLVISTTRGFDEFHLAYGYDWDEPELIDEMIIE